jgi:hypothetical protein
VTETTRISLIIPVTEPDSKVTSGSDSESVGSVDPYSESGSLQEGKNEKEPKKELPNELKASLGHLRLLLELEILSWRLKKKILQFVFKKIEFYVNVYFTLFSHRKPGSGSVFSKRTGSGSVFNQYNSESLKVAYAKYLISILSDWTSLLSLYVFL